MTIWPTEREREREREREISPSENRNYSQTPFPGLLIEYTNESLFPDLLAALRENRGTDYVAISGAKRPSKGWRRKEAGIQRWETIEKEEEREREREGWKGEPIDGIVWGGRRIICSVHRATEPDGPLTGANWASGDYRDTSGYKVPPLLALRSSARYLDSESGLKISLPLRIFIVRRGLRRDLLRVNLG